MNKNTETILEKLRDKKVGIFADDSNLFHAFRKNGWRVDFKKLKKLFSNYCDLRFINYHLAVPDKDDENFSRTEKFINKIGKDVVLKKKDLKYISVGTKKDRVVKKADVDVEIVLDVVRNIDKLDFVIIMSGDSDYLELKNYVVYDKRKKILFMGYEENMAWELRQCLHIYLNKIKEFISL